MGAFLQSTEGVVTEIMRIHRSLPPRPSLEEVEAAAALIGNMEREERARLDAISKKWKGGDVPDELFSILQDMERNLIRYQSKEQRREAERLMDLENVHALFDEFLQRASKCVPGSASYEPPAGQSNGSVSSTGVSSNTSSFGAEKAAAFYRPFTQRDSGRSGELLIKDDSYVKISKAAFLGDGITGELEMPSPAALASSAVKSASNVVVEDVGKLSFIKLASIIEVSAKNGAKEIDLKNKLNDQIEWLPDSVGKLEKLVKLDASENRIASLPLTIGSLSALTTLDLHSNRIAELTDSIGDLLNLICLNLRANQLQVLPPSIGKLSRLEELDVGCNRLVFLPETIGSLANLKKLSVETNDIEELPYTIGNCSSLVELRAEYNRLKALPEAVGKLESLEILTVRYNNIKMLPSTMASMASLKELDASFNELELVPEGLCLATTLVKLNVGNNFADLRSLPRSIGNLEMLEELDISNNQIRFLPDSFGLLSNLRVLRVDQNPLEVPPRQIAEMGAQAVVQYMVDYVAKKDVKTEPIKQRSSWSQFCFFSRPRKRKLDRMDYVRT